MCEKCVEAQPPPPPPPTISSHCHGVYFDVTASTTVLLHGIIVGRGSADGNGGGILYMCNEGSHDGHQKTPEVWDKVSNAVALPQTKPGSTMFSQPIRIEAASTVGFYLHSTSDTEDIHLLPPGKEQWSFSGFESASRRSGNISNEGRTLSGQGDWYWCKGPPVPQDQPSTYFYEVLIDKAHDTADLYFGFGDASLASIGDDSSVPGIYCYKGYKNPPSLYPSDKNLDSTAKIENGDVVRVELNTREFSVTFYRNGKEVGKEKIEDKHMSGKLAPFAVVYHTGTSCTLHNSGDDGAALANANADANVNAKEISILPGKATKGPALFDGVPQFAKHRTFEGGLIFSSCIVSVPCAALTLSRKHTRPLLHALCAGMCSQKMGRVLAVCDVGTHMNEEDGRQLLATACKKNLYIVAKGIIDQGIDVNAGQTDASGGSLLLLQAIKKNNVALSALLIDSQANVNTTDATGVSVLAQAAANNDSFLAKKLLEHNADTELVTRTGVTSLLVACHRGNTHMANMLLQHGANPDVADEDGNTPLSVACTVNMCRRFRCLKRAGVTGCRFRNSPNWADRPVPFIQPNFVEENAVIETQGPKELHGGLFWLHHVNGHWLPCATAEGIVMFEEVLLSTAEPVLGSTALAQSLLKHNSTSAYQHVSNVNPGDVVTAASGAGDIIAAMQGSWEFEKIVSASTETGDILDDGRTLQGKGDWYWATGPPVPESVSQCFFEVKVDAVEGEIDVFVGFGVAGKTMDASADPEGIYFYKSVRGKPILYPSGKQAPKSIAGDVLRTELVDQNSVAFYKNGDLVGTEPIKPEHVTVPLAPYLMVKNPTTKLSLQAGSASHAMHPMLKGTGQVAAVTATKDGWEASIIIDESDGQVSKASDLVKVPTVVCSGGHTCVMSSYADGNYSSGWVCNSCGTSKSGERWWCKECSDDFCYGCKPKNVVIHNAAARAIKTTFPTKALTVLRKHQAPLVHAACSAKNDELARTLINAPGTIIENDNAVHLLKFAVQNDLVQTIQALLQRCTNNQAIMDVVDAKLRSACASGNAAVMASLLPHTNTVNATGSNGNTLLAIACRNKDGTLVKLLLEHGADASLRNSSSVNPGDWVSVKDADDSFEKAFKDVFGQFTEEEKKNSGKTGQVNSVKAKGLGWVASVTMDDEDANSNQSMEITSKVGAESVNDSYYGVFFDVEALSASIDVTAIIAGAEGSSTTGSLWVCKKTGTFREHCSDRNSWEQVFDAVELKSKTKCQTDLPNSVRVDAGTIKGFYVHSTHHNAAVGYHNPNKVAHDYIGDGCDHAVLRPGTHSESSAPFSSIGSNQRQLAGGIVFTVGSGLLPTTVLSTTRPHPCPLLYQLCSNIHCDETAALVATAAAMDTTQEFGAQMLELTVKNKMVQTTESMLKAVVNGTGTGSTMNKLLVSACATNNKNLVQLLVRSKANPNVVDEQTSETPLTVAVKNKQAHIVEMLLNNGASQTTAHVSGVHAGDRVKVKEDSKEYQAAFQNVLGREYNKSTDAQCCNQAGQVQSVEWRKSGWAVNLAMDDAGMRNESQELPSGRLPNKSDGSHHGLFFNITAGSDQAVQIRSISAGAAGTDSVGDLYVTKHGGYQDQTESAHQWTKLSDKVTLKKHEATKTALQDGVEIPAGATRGFYLHGSANSEAVAYYNSGDSTWSSETGDITIVDGNISKSDTPFSRIDSATRRLCGSIEYSVVGASVPSTMVEVTRKHQSPLLYFACNTTQEDAVCSPLVDHLGTFDVLESCRCASIPCTCWLAPDLERLLQLTFNNKLPKASIGLLKLNAEHNAKNETVTEQLKAACAQGDSKKVKLLTECGADINATNDNGESLLQSACQGGHSAILKALLDQGADMSIEHPSGFNVGDTVTIDENNADFAEAFKDVLGEYTESNSQHCGKVGHVDCVVRTKKEEWAVDVIMSDAENAKSVQEIKSRAGVEDSTSSSYGT